MTYVFKSLFYVAVWMLLAGTIPSDAQTKPTVTTLGPDFPKSEIFIGNSFFYYNNSLHNHVTLMEKAADTAHAIIIARPR